MSGMKRKEGFPCAGREGRCCDQKYRVAQEGGRFGSGLRERSVRLSPDKARRLTPFGEETNNLQRPLWVTTAVDALIYGTCRRHGALRERNPERSIAGKRKETKTNAKD